jgi:hypothetical protein
LSPDTIETRVVRLLDEVLVPDVIGLAQAAAEDAIVAAGLNVGVVTTDNSDTVPFGDVISQDPVGGNVVLAGSDVDLVISLGPADVVVPDVVGLPQGAAEGAIAGANLVVGAVTTENSDTVPAGNVISQNPGGGASAAPGTPVDLVVSDGAAGVAPGRPENLAGRSKYAKVFISWQQPETATGSLVYRRLDGEAAFSIVAQPAGHSFLDNLPAGAAFAEYYVVATNAFGASDPSDTVLVARSSRR